MSEQQKYLPRDRVTIHPSHGLGEADKLDGRVGTILEVLPNDRYVVQISDPRSIFVRTLDGKLYLSEDELRPRAPAPPW